MSYGAKHDLDIFWQVVWDSALFRPSHAKRSHRCDRKWKTTSERRCAICLLSAAQTHLSIFTHTSDCNLHLTLQSAWNWRGCKCCFCRARGAVWNLRRAPLRSRATQKDRAARPFSLIILHLVNLAWRHLSGRLRSSMLSETKRSVNAMWPLFPPTCLPAHPHAWSSPGEGHLTLSVLIKPTATVLSCYFILDSILKGTIHTKMEFVSLFTDPIMTFLYFEECW